MALMNVYFVHVAHPVAHDIGGIMIGSDETKRIWGPVVPFFVIFLAAHALTYCRL
jgi:hypothetical protein